MTETPDVLIVGGGISGVSLAARLAPHMRVAVIEAEAHLGMHATGRSAALLVEAYGPPEIRALTKRSRSFFEAPPRGLAEAPLARRRGGLVYGGEDQFERLQSEFAEAARTTDVTWLDEAAVLTAAPLLRPGIAAAGFIEPNALDLDTDALLSAYARLARRHSAEIITAAPIDGIIPDGDGWRVTAGGRRFSAGVLVNAAGAWADAIAGMAGLAARRLQPRRRTAANVAVPGSLAGVLANHPFVAPVDESYYFKPETGAVMVSLSDETECDACDAVPEEMDVALALDRFYAATLVPPVRPNAAWAGLRTFAPDRRPVVGFDAGSPHFFWYAGQGGYGIQTSPALSELAAHMILGDMLDAADVRLAAELDPGRPALVSPS
jgi:D-arginine dehydrogenase